jgi:hypothetical protein
VPYRNGQAVNSESEIVKIDKYRQLTTTHMPSQLIDGGFNYQGDWVNINVTENSQYKFIKELKVNYKSISLSGYLVYYDCNMQINLNQNTQKIYIPNFENIWF